jgi:hypothetical protein
MLCCYQHNRIDSNEYNIKLHACQAFINFKYKNLKAKLVNCNANIYFNRQCLDKHIIPNYAKNIKIPYTSPAASQTQQKAKPYAPALPTLMFFVINTTEWTLMSTT